MKKSYPEQKPEVSAKQKALDLLLYRTRTEKELFEKLLEKGYSEEESAEALEYVRHFGYVNDEDYALRYVSSHMHEEGRYALKRRLAEKGIPDEFIETALLELPDEEEVIAKILERKYGGPRELSEREYRRIFSYFLRHGFSAGAIKNILKRTAEEEPL